jgi:hypothetical protein
MTRKLNLPVVSIAVSPYNAVRPMMNWSTRFIRSCHTYAWRAWRTRRPCGDGYEIALADKGVRQSEYGPWYWGNGEGKDLLTNCVKKKKLALPAASCLQGLAPRGTNTAKTHTHPIPACRAAARTPGTGTGSFDHSLGVRKTRASALATTLPGREA